MRVVISIFIILYSSMQVFAHTSSYTPHVYNDPMVRRCWRLSTGVSGFNIQISRKTLHYTNNRCIVTADFWVNFKRLIKTVSLNIFIFSIHDNVKILQPVRNAQERDCHFPTNCQNRQSIHRQAI